MLVLFALYLLSYVVLVRTAGPDLGGLAVVWVVAIWGILHALDAHSTIRFVRRDGIGAEGNRLVRWAMRKFGVAAGNIALKVVGVPLLTWAVIDRPVVLAAWSIVLALVVVNNYLAPARSGRRDTRRIS